MAAAAGAGAAGVSASDVAVHVAAGETALKVHVGTWNVGNKNPRADFAPWIPKAGGDFDVIVVGLQESTYKIKPPKDDGEVSSDEEEGADAGDEDGGTTPASRGATGGAAAAAGSSEAKEGDDAGDKKKGSSLSGAVDTSAPKKVSSQHILAMVQAHIGGGFFTVAEANLLEMNLVVMAANKHEGKITEVEAYREATGIGGVWGNKGGLVIKFNAYGSPLCFVSCHLAAHQGEKHMLARNANVEEVITETRFANKDVDLDAQFHHCFWLGDLNYRVDLGITTGKKYGKEKHEEHWDAVSKLITEEKWDDLMAADQLVHQQRAGKVFVGFKEGKYTFPPTFKVNRVRGMDYKKQRVSSYCDRVLWKSLPARADDVTLDNLSSHPSIGTSDHKPVSASFTVKCSAPPTLGAEAAEDSFPRVEFLQIKCTDLLALDPNGKSDPYVKFHSEPAGALFSATSADTPVTKMKPKTLDPTYNRKEIPSLKARVTTPAELARCTALLTVVDWDRMNADDEMGQAVVDLSRAATVKGPHNFNARVTRGSVARGLMSGQVEVIWPDDPRYHEKRSTDNLDNRGCCTVM